MAESGASVGGESGQIHIQLFGCLDDFNIRGAGYKHRFSVDSLGAQPLSDLVQPLLFTLFRFNPNLCVKGFGRGGYDRLLPDADDIEFSLEALSQGDAYLTAC